MKYTKPLNCPECGHHHKSVPIKGGIKAFCSCVKCGGKVHVDLVDQRPPEPTTVLIRVEFLHGTSWFVEQSAHSPALQIAAAKMRNAQPGVPFELTYEEVQAIEAARDHGGTWMFE